MTISTASTVEVIPASGGNLPDGLARASLRVTARRTDGQVPSRAQVRVSALTAGANVIHHEHVHPTIGDLVMTETDDQGVAVVEVSTTTEGTVRYLVEVGEDQDQIDTPNLLATLNNLVGKPERDVPVGRPSTAPTAVLWTTAQTIDEAWIAANMNGRRAVHHVFTAPVTLDYDDTAGDIAFIECLFSVASSVDYAFITNNHRYQATRCGFRGAGVSTVLGPGGLHAQCAWDACGRDGVRITQSGSFQSNQGLPDDFTETKFLHCLFRRIGTATPGYAVHGLPMRNVTLDHCWLDVAAAGAMDAQTSGSVLAAVRQVTDAGGARGPFMYGCWIGGGVAASVEVVTGTSGQAAQFFALRGCRFEGAARGGANWVPVVQASQFPAIGGNIDEDGRLLTSLNIEPGPRVLFTPLAQLDAQPEIAWSSGGTGDPGNPGGGGGPVIPTDPGRPPQIEGNFLYRVQALIDFPVGTGNGGRVIRTRKLTEVPSAADPVPLESGGGAPPVNPLIVQWTGDNVILTEGSPLLVFCELFDSTGAQPDISSLRGYSVPVTVQYAAVGTATAMSPEDIVVPATIEIPAGSAIGSLLIEAVDDIAPEGLESCRLVLNAVTVEDEQGSQVVVVTPGTASSLPVFIPANDATTPGIPEVIFGTTSLSLNELNQVNTFRTPTQVLVPVVITGEPSAQAQVRVTFTGTATLGQDYEIITPTVPGSPNQIILTFAPGQPLSLNAALRVLGDNTDESNETVVMTLTTLDATRATIGVQDTFTLTILDDDEPAGAAPILGWQETTVSMFEATGTSQIGTRNVGITAINNQPLTVPTTIRVQVVELAGEATYGNGGDIEVFWAPPNPGSMEGLVGLIPRQPGVVNPVIQLRGVPDADTEGDEIIVLRILPNNGYTVDPARSQLTVTLRDPVQGGNTQLFVKRIDAPVPTLVSTTVTTSGIDLANGYTMIGPGGETNCQWHPVAYKPDGTPDAVRVWGLVAPGSRSVPGGSETIFVRGGESVEPTPPINVATQLTEVLASNLRLTLRHNVNGETRDFTLPFDVSSANYSALVDTANVALQGDGPRLFARHRMKGRLAAPTPSDRSTDYCTVARMYLDCRADLDVVVVAINWGNYRWAQPDFTFTQYQPNPEVDGEVFFDYLHLDGIPSGWSAELLDPNTTRTAYDGANNRVEVIKPLGGAQRHFLPIMRGHVAWIALYKPSATVTSDVARDVLRQNDSAYCIGGLGYDQADVLGESGFPGLDYGSGAVPFVNINQTSVPVQSGWNGVEDFAKDERDRIQDASRTGMPDIGLGSERIGWWHGFGDADGGGPSGDRVNVAAGVSPGQWHSEKTRLEMCHLWHRVGSTAWTPKGDSVRDSDYTVTSGTRRLSAVATWIGIGNQRMLHHQFYNPEFETRGPNRVSATTHLAPGRKRARGTVSLAAVSDPGPTNGDVLVVAGDEIVVSDGVNAAMTFRFGTGTDTATLKHVAIATKANTTANNLLAAMNLAEGVSTLAIHATRNVTGDVSNGLDLIARYAGTTQNQTITTNASPRIAVTGMANGSNGTNVRLWNYLVHGTNTCSHTVSFSQNRGMDITLAWYNRNVNVDKAFHSFDWPHMSRMNRVTRDGWWMHFDPIAYDIATDLGNLATQCMMRYEYHRQGIYYNGDENTRVQLVSSASGANLWAILDGHNRRMLKFYIESNFDSDRPAAQFAGVLAQNQGLECGMWAIVNPFFPGTIPLNSFDVVLSGEWPIGREWGWLMCTVARAYAIEGALRPTSTKDEWRLHIHPATQANPFLEDRPSWPDMVRDVIRQTAHKSGAAGSQDKNGTSQLYASPPGQQFRGSPDFDTRRGDIPGGPLNESVQPQFDDEWYANTIAWHNTFVCMGTYAIMRRVYTWTDHNTAPSPSNVWKTTVYDKTSGFGKRVVLAAKHRMGETQFTVPRYSLVGIGDPNTPGTGVHGRFNTEIGGANPDLVFRHPDGLGWWWAETSPGPGLPTPSATVTSYDVLYMFWAFMRFRTHADTELARLVPGLVGRGGGSPEQNAAGAAEYLMVFWQERRRSGGTRYFEDGDMVAPIVSWMRNYLGAP